MGAERKPGKRPPQQPSKPGDVASRPGLANRGFGSMDPERQREVGSDCTVVPSDATPQHEGGAAPRAIARDHSPRTARGTADPDRKEDAGSA